MFYFLCVQFETHVRYYGVEGKKYTEDEHDHFWSRYAKKHDFQPKPLCNITNDEYRTYLMSDAKDHSDLPISEDPKVNLCEKFDRVNLLLLFKKQILKFFYFFRKILHLLIFQ